jgi:GNAT superfamily N-acetyltransferase
METLRLSSEPNGDVQDANAIENQIDAYNIRITGHDDYSPIRIYLRDENGALRGGITADVWGGWLDIKFLWVDEDLRKQGYGAQLLSAAEEEARAYGCRHARVATFSFQARPFYERFGYTVVATFEDYPPGHSHYILRKSLL